MNSLVLAMDSCVGMGSELPLEEVCGTICPKICKQERDGYITVLGLTKCESSPANVGVPIWCHYIGISYEHHRDIRSSLYMMNSDGVIVYGVSIITLLYMV